MGFYERRRDPLLPPALFRRRLLQHGGAALSVILGSLVLGVIGYHLFAGLSWLDALLNASMILGGMGPVDPLVGAPAKWFASLYALYSGVALLTSVSVLFAPVVHRVLHRFHLEDADMEESDAEQRSGKRRGRSAGRNSER